MSTPYDVAVELAELEAELAKPEAETPRSRRTRAAKVAKIDVAKLLPRGGWEDQIMRSDRGAPLKIAANAITILTHAPAWCGVLAYDELRETITKIAPPPWDADDATSTPELGELTELDATRITAWLSRHYGLHVSPTVAVEAASVVAHRRRIHPVRSYLESLTWDETERLPTMLTRYAGAPDDAYTRAVSTRMLIAAVARVYEPGCLAQTVPVLEGSQGTGKSSFVAALCFDRSWYFESEIEIGDKEAPQSLRGKWIVEFGELSAMSRAEQGAMKAFVSRNVDTYRPSFGRVARDYPRRWIAIGTTNEDRYLRDATGNRRWLPVRTGKIDLVALRADLGQLWAEARARYQRGEAWHVDDADFARLAKTEQEDRYAADPWEQAIGAWLEGRRVQIVRDGGITTGEILAGALDLGAKHWTRADEMRCAEVLTRLGWVKGAQCRRNGVRVRPYLPPIRQVVTDVVTDVVTSPNHEKQAQSQLSLQSQHIHIDAGDSDKRWSVHTRLTENGSDSRDGRDGPPDRFADAEHDGREPPKGEAAE